MMGCAPSNGREKAAPVVVSRDHFTFDFVIGEGGFGTVYSAMCRKNKKWYAVKEINKYELLTHRTGFKMLYGELNALKAVNHPFIAGMDFAFHNAENAYIVLSLKTGADLRHYLKKKLIFEECNVAFYVSCISSALDHCHSRHVLHRDVKPENIILDAQGFPHLTDFGVAYVQSEQDGNEFDRSPALCSTLASGTKQYLAPEVFTKGHVHGPESDFWALGVVAYELLHGIRPFTKHVPNVMISYLQKSREKYSSTGEARKREKEKEKAKASKVTVGANSSIRVGLKQQRQQQKEEEHGGQSSHLHDAGDSLSSGVTTHSPGSSRMSTPFGSPSATPMSTQAADAVTTGPDTAASPTRKRPPIFPRIADAAKDDGSWANEKDKEVEDASGSVSVRFGGESTTNEAESSPSSEGRSSIDDAASNEMELVKTDIYGTFWVYPYDPSTAEGLKVQIPSSNAWLGAISKECQEVLQGLFEVRPTHRWGGRNVNKLREHAWFVSRNISDWRNLSLKNPDVTPHFIPGKALLQEKVKHEPERRHEASDERSITQEQEKQFADFNFTHPDMIPILQEASSTPTAGKSTTLSSSVTTEGHDVNYQALDITRRGHEVQQQECKLLPDMTAQSFQEPAADAAPAGGPGSTGFYGSKPNPAKLLAAAASRRPSTTLSKKESNDRRSSNLLKEVSSKHDHSVSSWISGARRDGLGTARNTSRKQPTARAMQQQQSQQQQQQKKKGESSNFAKSYLNFNAY